MASHSRHIFCALLTPACARALGHQVKGYVGNGLPTGFEAAAVARFRAYIAQRFGARTREFFGVDAADVSPPVARQRNSSGETVSARCTCCEGNTA